MPVAGKPTVVISKQANSMFASDMESSSTQQSSSSSHVTHVASASSKSSSSHVESSSSSSEINKSLSSSEIAKSSIQSGQMQVSSSSFDSQSEQQRSISSSQSADGQRHQTTLVVNMPAAGKPTVITNDVYIGGETFDSSAEIKRRSLADMPAAGKPTIVRGQMTSNVTSSTSEVERLRSEIDARAGMTSSVEQKTMLAQQKIDGRKLSSIHEEQVSMTSRRQMEIEEQRRHMEMHSSHVSDSRHVSSSTSGMYNLVA